ncbi:MAG: nucleotide-binding protein, partial [Oscillospiraceae bacterium]|nr:nucleotide-binding protein [Oscillospiraceae bacterium]
MEKAKKLEILDDIKFTLSKCNYGKKYIVDDCEIRLVTFIEKNSISDRYIKQMENIKYSLSYRVGSHQRRIEYWEKGVTQLISIIELIKSEIELYDDEKPIKENSPEKNHSFSPDKIFIVHGHNETMKYAVKDVLTSLRLTPIIFHEEPNQGRTIIEKLEWLSEDVGFAIVLLSADDEMKDGKFQARQNVILELGYFVAKLGRENVVALYDTSKEVVIPSDISGVLYEPYESANGAWRT